MSSTKPRPEVLVLDRFAREHPDLHDPKRCLLCALADQVGKLARAYSKLEVRALRREIAREDLMAQADIAGRRELVAMLRELEWRHDTCPECGRTRRQRHAEDCRLATLFARYGGQQA